MTGAEAARLGPIRLESGVSRTNAWTLLYGAFVTIGLVTGMAVLTPYLLSETLGLDEGAKGRALGTLTVLNELVLILAYGPLGALSDRFGRRIVYVGGVLAMATAYLLFPLAAAFGNIAAVRILYALGIGAATGMYGTLLADYAVERDRGKLAAIGGILNGLGVVLLALAFGAPRHGGRPPLPAILQRGAAAARRSPEIVLGYAAAFVARGDLAVVGIFTVAWGQQAAAAAGLSPSEALEAGRIPFIVAQSAALLWPLALIAVIDRLPRARMLTLAMALAALGYLAMGLVADPLATSAIPFFVAIGIGQISAVLGAQTLIGKAAPATERGAVIGLFTFSGALGILLIGGAAGWAFDRLGPASPFLIVGGLNAAVALAALAVARRAAPA